MRQAIFRSSPILSGTIFLTAALALATLHRSEDCIRRTFRGRIKRQQPWPMDRRRPSRLPQKVVFVRVEADKSDIEVGWAEN